MREKNHRRILMMLRGGTDLSRLKLADGKVCPTKRECVGNVGRMKK